jgi:hypothetical protein
MGNTLMMGDDPRLIDNASAKFARKQAEAAAARRADTTTPLVGRAPLETLPEPPLFDDGPPDLPCIEIQTTVEHRGRSFTVVARGYTLDQLCDMLDKRGYTAAAQTQEWQTLPDGTPICPKHHTPMRKRERQGDTWYSHSAGKGADGKDIYCKGYHGKDSPGYEVD